MTENIALVKSIPGNKKIPLLIDLSKSPVPDKKQEGFLQNSCPGLIRLWCQNPGFRNTL